MPCFVQQAAERAKIFLLWFPFYFPTFNFILFSSEYLQGPGAARGHSDLALSTGDYQIKNMRIEQKERAERKKRDEE